MQLHIFIYKSNIATKIIYNIQNKDKKLSVCFAFSTSTKMIRDDQTHHSLFLFFDKMKNLSLFFIIIYYYLLFAKLPLTNTLQQSVHAVNFLAIYAFGYPVKKSNHLLIYFCIDGKAVIRLLINTAIMLHKSITVVNLLSYFLFCVRL